jgi:hypothetical protein
MRDALWVLLLLGGVVLTLYLVQLDGEQSVHAADVAKSVALFENSGVELSALEINVQDTTVRVERGESGWFYALRPPTKAVLTAVEANFIAERLRMFGATRLERSFPLAEHAPASYGFETPAMQVKLFLNGAAEATQHFTAGKRTPDGFGQYLLLEPRVRVVVVAAYQIENLARLTHGP